MGPAQVTDVTRLIMASFGIGIGVVVVPLVFNFLADAAGRRKHRQKYALPPLSAYEHTRPTQAPPAPGPTQGPSRLPAIRRPG
jgi:hypothetical protein